ncbi:TonB-dependent receptor [Glacieibacterium frigidum]|uniref:TonB-dependent receptor n=1 Tax=Glacieibacterium frigidum TaxID=2593303 RepID=UPI00163DA696|nr:TonB-dependent receptor [Glacieibacterium frigidum]
MKHIHLAGTAILLASLAAPAAAQTAPVAPETASTEQSDIVVTARRRSESVQDVPLAVTAFGQAEFERQQVVDLEDLNLGVPNLTVVRNTGTTTGAQVYLRGVGQDDSSFTGEPSIGIYLDDVYIGRQIGGVLDVLDFERIEVLRGPQGTLYGRNSSGGAIKYVTRRPDLNDMSVSGAVTFGTYDRFDVTATASVPLIDGKLAIKADGGSRDQRGWARLVDATGADTGRRANGIDSQSARLSALYAPDDALSIYLSADVSRNRSGPQAIISTNCTGLIVPPVTAITVVCPYRFGPRRTGFGAPDINRFSGFGSNATIEYDTGKGSVRAITGYRTFSDDVAIDLSGNPAAPFNLIQYLDQRQFSQEVQFASDLGGSVDFVTGVYYFNEKIDQDATFSGFRNFDTQKAQSYAAYAEVYAKPLDGLTITLGARISKDRKRIDRQFFLTPTATVPSVVLNDATGDNRFSDSKFTPKIGIDYKLGPDVLAYASWSKGYKAGGFAAARPTSVAQVSGQFSSETVNSYEAGIKSELFDRVATLNGSVFLANYSNLQSSVLGGNGSFTVVSGDAKFYGAEVEATVRPTRGLSLYGLLGLLHDEWTRQPQGIPTAIRLKHAPRAQFKVGGSFDTPVTERLSAYLVANYRWTDEIYRNTANNLNILAPSYGLLDASIGFGASDGKWKLLLSGQNLTDKVYVTQGVSTLGRYLGEPRTIALTLKASF